MSINSNMKEVTLQTKEKVETESGAEKYNWVDKDTIYVSIYKPNYISNYSINTQPIRYNGSTHTGLTFYKDIKESDRLVDSDGVIYDVTSTNPSRRLNNLLLKVVDLNV